MNFILIHGDSPRPMDSRASKLMTFPDLVVFASLLSSFICSMLPVTVSSSCMGSETFAWSSMPPCIEKEIEIAAAIMNTAIPNSIPLFN